MGTLRETTNKSNQLTLSDCVFRVFKNNFKIINVWFEVILTGRFSQEKYFFWKNKTTPSFAVYRNDTCKPIFFIHIKT